MNKLAVKELMRSKEEKRILIVKISEIEDEYYKLKNENIIKNRWKIIETLLCLPLN